jgi:OmpA-OmpF porin, OOP family
MKFRIALLTATVLAVPLVFSHVASAQPVTGPYVSGGAGYNIATSPKGVFYTNTNKGQISQAGRIVMHNGWTIQGSAGYGFGNGFRAEVEGDYIDDNFSKATINGHDFASGGHEGRYGIFVNGFYDFDVGLPYLYPYVGGGIGWQIDAFNNFHPDGFYINKNKDALAYQGIAGIAFPITPVPGLSATLEYRFVGLEGARKFNGVFTPTGQTASLKVKQEYNNQIVVGLRYQLFQPPPPAPPPAPAPVAAPAPAPAKTYLVFFDWDRYNLTPRATQIIAQAASDSHTSNVTTINVSGYTDTSGTPQYNMGLSMRRAQSVAGQLVTDGVPQSEIEIHAFGETHLLVPTGPGVREPQNRRVEIVLQ